MLDPVQQSAVKRRRLDSISPAQHALAPLPLGPTADDNERPTRPRWRRPPPLSGPKYVRVLEAMQKLREPFFIEE